MGYKPQGPDVFTLKSGYIECLSGTGRTYKVTHDSCSCKGFSFRRECRHYRQARQKGLLNKLETQIVKKQTYKPGVFTGHMKKMRMDANKTYLLSSFKEDFMKETIENAAKSPVALPELLPEFTDIVKAKEKTKPVTGSLETVWKCGIKDCLDYIRSLKK
jgi:hypothetical protein